MTSDASKSERYEAELIDSCCRDEQLVSSLKRVKLAINCHALETSLGLHLLQTATGKRLSVFSIREREECIWANALYRALPPKIARVVYRSYKIKSPETDKKSLALATQLARRWVTLFTAGWAITSALVMFRLFIRMSPEDRRVFWCSWSKGKEGPFDLRYLAKNVLAGKPCNESRSDVNEFSLVLDFYPDPGVTETAKPLSATNIDELSAHAQSSKRVIWIGEDLPSVIAATFGQILQSPNFEGEGEFPLETSLSQLCETAVIARRAKRCQFDGISNNEAIQAAHDWILLHLLCSKGQGRYSLTAFGQELAMVSERVKETWIEGNTTI